MAHHIARSLDDALAILEADPDTVVAAGGTDLMVDINAGRRRPAAVMNIERIAQLSGWRREGERLFLGAALTYHELLTSELVTLAPALAQAARTVGSPQIRNAGTIGGNIATASPAGDTLPVLAALDAEIELASPRGGRRVVWHDFFTGPKRTSRRPDELIVGVRIAAATGPQEFLKVGTRNAMVIAIASVCVVLDPRLRQVRCALGSVGPTVLRAEDAERWVSPHLDWERAGSYRLQDAGTAAAFGAMVAGASRPIDDHRSTAAYRRRAIDVCARRALERCCGQHES
jgi:CO/xanthine dehydrogenase FAD-binding subunit